MTAKVINIKDGKEIKKAKSSPRAMTEIQKQYCDNLKTRGEEGRSFAEAFEKGILSAEAFELGREEIFKRERQSTPDRDHYRRLFKAINDGKFNKGAKFEFSLYKRLISDLEKEGPAREKAINTIGKISRGGKLTREQAENLDEELQESEKGKTDLEGTLDSVSLKTRFTIAKGEMEETLRKAANIESDDEENKKRFRNYEPLKFPEGTKEKFEELGALWKEALASDKHLDEIDQELKTATGQRKEELEKLFAETRDRLFKELDRVIDEKSRALRKEIGDLNERELAAKRILADYSEQLGTEDLRNCESLKTKDGETIEIVKIFFDFDETKNLKDDPGMPYIIFNRGGREHTALLRDFTLLFGRSEVVYDEKMTLEKTEESLGITLQENDEFFREFMGEDNRYHRERFKVTRVNREKSRERIVLENPDDRRGVRIMPGVLMSHTADENLREDVFIKECTPGQFEKLIKVLRYVKGNLAVALPEEGEKKLVRTKDGREVEMVATQSNDGRTLYRLLPSVAKIPEQRKDEPIDEEYDYTEALTPFLKDTPQGVTRLDEFRKRNPITKKAAMDALNKGDLIAHEGPHEEHAEPKAEHDKSHAEPGAPKEATANFQSTEEALPFDQIHKVGGMQETKRGYLATLWMQTRKMSIDDFWQMFKVGYEYYDRRFRRDQQGRFSDIAGQISYFAPEMGRIHQQAENEEVNHEKEALEQMGIWQIEDHARHAKNTDALKACMIVLSEKGELRFDDIELWKTINKYVPDTHKYIPIPSNGDPSTEVDDGTERTGMDFLEEAIDSIWGEGTYSEWYSHNKSAYQSNRDKYAEKGDELEGVEGGHTRRLSELLRRHKHGIYVSPHEYEGLIVHSIDRGKSDAESKLYYMIEGVTAKNPHGHTIMGFDRIAHINSKMVANFPLLDWVCFSPSRAYQGDSHRFTLDDYEQWRKNFDGDDPMNCMPNQRVVDFIWNHGIPNDKNIIRTNKDLRNADKLDHDDMHMILPVATTSVITQACQTQGGGGKEMITKEGYCNGFAGFSQYFRTMGQHNNTDLLRTGIQSYVRFEGIMMKKYQRSAKTRYARLDEDIIDRRSVVSSYKTKWFVRDLNNLVYRVLQAYAPLVPQEGNRIYRMIELMSQTPEQWLNKTADQDKRDSDELDRYYENFDAFFKKITSVDKGQTMMQIVNGTELVPVEYIDAATKARIKADIEKRKKLDENMTESMAEAA